MSHDDHYHVHSDRTLPAGPVIGPPTPVPSNLTVLLPVPPNVLPGPPFMEFYSLERDLTQLRRDALAKGILSRHDQLNIGSSNGENPQTILSLVIGGNLQEGNAAVPKVLIVGGHHAREWISVELPYLIAEYLIDRYDPSPGVPANDSAAPGTKAGQAQRIKHLVGNREIWFVPMLNPEGHTHTITRSRRWRTNRAIKSFPVGDTIVAPRLGGGSRTIRIPPLSKFVGVDLNRNYATGTWGFETISKENLSTSRNPEDCGDDKDFGGQFYCGPSPASESETAALSKLMKDEKFSAVISYHSFAEDILAPDATFGDDFTSSVGNGMSSLIAERGGAYKFAPASSQDVTTGDTMDFYVEKVPGRRPAYTIELSPNSDAKGTDRIFSGLPETEIRGVFQQNLAAALAVINCAGFNAAPNRVSTTINLESLPWITTVIPNCWDRFRHWDPAI